MFWWSSFDSVLNRKDFQDKEVLDSQPRHCSTPTLAEETQMNKHISFTNSPTVHTFSCTTDALAVVSHTHVHMCTQTHACTLHFHYIHNNTTHWWSQSMYSTLANDQHPHCMRPKTLKHRQALKSGSSTATMHSATETIQWAFCHTSSSSKSEPSDWNQILLTYPASLMLKCKNDAQLLAKLSRIPSWSHQNTHKGQGTKVAAVHVPPPDRKGGCGWWTMWVTVVENGTGSTWGCVCWPNVVMSKQDSLTISTPLLALQRAGAMNAPHYTWILYRRERTMRKQNGNVKLQPSFARAISSRDEALRQLACIVHYSTWSKS